MNNRNGNIYLHLSVLSPILNTVQDYWEQEGEGRSTVYRIPTIYSFYYQCLLFFVPISILSYIFLLESNSRCSQLTYFVLNSPIVRHIVIFVSHLPASCMLSQINYNSDFGIVRHLGWQPIAALYKHKSKKSYSGHRNGFENKEKFGRLYLFSKTSKNKIPCSITFLLNNYAAKLISKLR